MLDGRCEFETLAEGHGCRVERCSHGVIHVTVGGVTLRLEARQCYDLTRTLRAAAAQVERPSTTARALR